MNLPYAMPLSGIASTMYLTSGPKTLVLGRVTFSAVNEGLFVLERWLEQLRPTRPRWGGWWL